MPELSCPQCGRLGNVPRNKLESRLVCKKCHAIFHMNKAGRVVLGEPHSEGRGGTRTAVKTARAADKKGSWVDYFSLSDGVTPQMRAGLLGGGVVLLGLVVWMLMPAPTLADRAKDAAMAFKSGDKQYLKSLALAKTSREVENWYNIVHPRLEAKMKEWKTNDVRVEVRPDVIENNEGSKVTVIFMPDGPLTPELLKNSMDLSFVWRKRGGKWRINGKATVNSAAMGANVPQTVYQR